MLRELKAAHEAWPLATPFRISRGVKVIADVVVVEVRQGNARGRGESVPYARYGETVDSVLEQVRSITTAIAGGMTRETLQEALPPGAARNALDCALWDLSASLTAKSVTAQLGQGPLPALTSALTIGIDTPDAMRAAAVQLRAAPLIKVKVDAGNPEAQLRAVRAGAPNARLIVDPNESWNIEILEAMQPVLVDVRVELIEQPLPAKDDAALEGFRPVLPICADESCHVAADLPKLLKRYQAINIKLDKTGGLSGALELLQQARNAGLQVMCGCMVCTSLGIAPAFHIARHSDFVDLDGPLWLKQDHPGGARVEAGKLLPPSDALWGGGGRPPHSIISTTG
jgi:L-alanine-DL-glutamate epimerase-like enolase superfamily enzyme